MKLRNKKTGEIRDFIINKDKIQTASAIDCWEYNSLAELNEEWEDYKERKEWWFIDCTGSIKHGDRLFTDETDIKKIQQIGNYFDTVEEAEKAVERLKAWKRLKDKGLYFVRDAVKEGEYKHNFVLRPMMDKRYVTMHDAKEIYNDIKLIFNCNVKEVKNE